VLGTWENLEQAVHGSNAIAINVSNWLYLGFRGLLSSII
jgi:hypothetical protein